MDIHKYLKRTDRRCRYPKNIYTAEANGEYTMKLHEHFVFVDKDGLRVRGACETRIPEDEGPVIQIMLN